MVWVLRVSRGLIYGLSIQLGEDHGQQTGGREKNDDEIYDDDDNDDDDDNK